VPGFNRLTASTKIPRNPIITEATVEYEKYYAYQISKYVAESQISFTDPTEEDDFYQILFYTTNYNLDSSLILYRSDYLFSNEPVIVNEGDIQLLVSGSEINDLMFSDNLLKDNNMLIFQTGLSRSVFGKNFVLLRAISPEYYLYKKSIIRQFVNNNFNAFFDINTLFYSDNPVDLYSNIENGLGIFAGYSETHFELQEIQASK